MVNANFEFNLLVVTFTKKTGQITKTLVTGQTQAPTLALTLIFLTRSSSPAKGCIILPLVHSLDNKLSLFSGAARNSGNEVHEILVNLTPKIPYYPNLPQFQGVRPDHMRFESSKSLFLGELVTYDP